MNSHDVRKMKVCCECNTLGIYADAHLASKLEIPLLVSNGPKKYICPRHLSIDVLAVKSCKELGEIRLCDLTPNDMETLLLVMKNRRENTEIPGIEMADC